MSRRILLYRPISTTEQNGFDRGSRLFGTRPATWQIEVSDFVRCGKVARELNAPNGIRTGLAAFRRKKPAEDLDDEFGITMSTRHGFGHRNSLEAPPMFNPPVRLAAAPRCKTAGRRYSSFRGRRKKCSSTVPLHSRSQLPVSAEQPLSIVSASCTSRAGNNRR